MISDTELPSTRPYLIRALYEWCSENGFTPYVAVKVDNSVQVPREYVQGGEIVLNVSMDATSSLKLGNEFIEFKARFGGKPRDIMVPIHRVMAIYARENGQGMAFPPPVDMLAGGDVSPVLASAPAVPVAAAPTPSDDRVVQLRFVTRASVRNFEIEHCGNQVAGSDHEDSRLGGRVHVVCYAGNVKLHQVFTGARCDQNAPQHGTHDDGQNRQALDPAVGFYQSIMGKQLGQNAVFGG